MARVFPILQRYAGPFWRRQVQEPAEELLRWTRTHVRGTQSKLQAEKLRNPGVWTVLNTSTLPESAKGPAHAAAFVWAADCNLYLHTHAHDFVHASVKQGKKIRCSGMLVAENGIVTYMSNTSGHYAPNAQSLYNLGWWLLAKKCVNGSTTIPIPTAPQKRDLKSVV